MSDSTPKQYTFGRLEKDTEGEIAALMKVLSEDGTMKYEYRVFDHPEEPLDGMDSIAGLDAAYEKYKTENIEPSYCAALMDLLKPGNLPPQEGDYRVDAMFCTGMDGFSSDQKGYILSGKRGPEPIQWDMELKLPAFTQLYTIEALQAYFGVEAKNVTFQEPELNNCDIEWLRSKGYTVKEEPDGFNGITEHTFVYAPWAVLGVVGHILEVTYPTYFLGNGMQDPFQPAKNYIEDQYIIGEDFPFYEIGRVKDYRGRYLKQSRPMTRDWSGMIRDCLHFK